MKFDNCVINNKKKEHRIENIDQNDLEISWGENYYLCSIFYSLCSNQLINK